MWGYSDQFHQDISYTGHSSSSIYSGIVLFFFVFWCNQMDNRYEKLTTTKEDPHSLIYSTYASRSMITRKRYAEADMMVVSPSILLPILDHFDVHRLLSSQKSMAYNIRIIRLPNRA
jgi:hypothetical protein